jgi:protein disulfide-isomerase
MRRHRPRLVTNVFFYSMLALPALGYQSAAAQQAGFGASAASSGIRWQQDLEAAKILARQTGRLVLIHFWTPECAPCVTLEESVFNQPGVGGAIEAQFVPVKLNANENSATAQGYGITRVPTDVIITPDGAVVGKLISPPTPSAYVAEVTQTAAAHRSKPGAPFARATATVPTPPQLNAAYANLSVSPSVPPAAAQPTASESQAAASTVSMVPAPAAPVSSANQYAPPATASAVRAPFSPPVNQPVAAPAPNQLANPHVAAAPVAGPASMAPGAPAPLAQQPQTSSAVGPVGEPNAQRLPPGAPPLGFDGYCPVSMRNHWKWVAGDPRWGIVHRGRTYWFAGQSEQQQFWTDPDRYSPALSGMDPVMVIDHGQQVPGKREHSIDYDNLFYMFSSEATLQQFTANPERYAVGVREAMGIPRGRLVR